MAGINFMLITLAVLGNLLEGGSVNIYSGNEFIVTLLPAFNNQKTTGYLLIGHTQEGMCTVTDSDGTEHGVKLQGNNRVTQFDIPLARVLNFGGYIEKRAIYVHCNTEIILRVFFRRQMEGTADAYTVLPLQSLSSKYIIPSVPQNAILGIVAADDNVTIHVDIKSNCSYSFKGITYSQGRRLTSILEKRHVLQISSLSSTEYHNCDMGGTVVESSSPVAVFSGSPALDYPLNHGDAVQNQIPGVSHWGSSFIVSPVPVMDKYRIRILAMNNNTHVTTETPTATTSFNLNEAEFSDEDFNNSDVTYVKSSQPILVQMTSGNHVRFQAFSAIVPPIADYGSVYLVPDVQTSQVNYTRYITLITSPNCTSDIDVNTIWTTSSTASHTASVSSFRAPSDLTVLRSKSSLCQFAVLVTGLGNIEMYGYFDQPIIHDTLTSVTFLNATKNTLHATEFDVLTLVCRANPIRGKPKISWKKDSHNVSEKVASQAMDVRGKTVPTSVLTLTVSCKDHLSVISCKAVYKDVQITSTGMRMFVHCAKKGDRFDEGLGIGIGAGVGAVVVLLLLALLLLLWSTGEEDSMGKTYFMFCR
ncbi:uncharacterized protein LOC124276226 isoform X2 [Haliotis rubra]|uniref:uncharacterized protein LOC124276226 isoform X2 n=1 Tax=Haliotis rubra TaxID=36100 RepID=UPI001EE4F296|nr:uncharacterized protein LOC124276226 isoform X2 [Haliotis rubra]